MMRTLRRAATLAVLGAAVALAGCSTVSPMARSALVPAADGKVDAKVGDNGNVKVLVVVDHLAPPGRIAAGATTYVVWATPTADDARPQNLGALVLDDKLKGKLETVTPHRNFLLTITPEVDAMVSQPAGPTVLEHSLSVK